MIVSLENVYSLIFSYLCITIYHLTIGDYILFVHLNFESSNGKKYYVLYLQIFCYCIPHICLLKYIPKLYEDDNDFYIRDLN